jgi:hypothetical protein
MPGVEASLDIEYIMALGALVPTTFWSNQQSNEENLRTRIGARLDRCLILL